MTLGYLRRLHDALKNKQKRGSAIDDLGCTIQEFIVWIENQFYDHPVTGKHMTWANQGTEWHTDHIQPLISFDPEDVDQLHKACNYTNIQPLWAEENLRKGDKIMGKRSDNQSLYEALYSSS